MSTRWQGNPLRIQQFHLILISSEDAYALLTFYINIMAFRIIISWIGRSCREDSGGALFIIKWKSFSHICNTIMYEFAAGK